ncbi:MAG: UDP-glucose 4-epimerase GalE, partial [Beggiatoa sp.]|nr:UDP-glucose 4-epimerase GalE [Beggiatoa sp.]
YSVREVIAAVEKAAGQGLPVREGPRRAGDPPVLVAGADRIRRVLGWQPRYDDLHTIVETSLRWEHNRAY